MRYTNSICLSTITSKKDDAHCHHMPKACCQANNLPFFTMAQIKHMFVLGAQFEDGEDDLFLLLQFWTFLEEKDSCFLVRSDCKDVKTHLLFTCLVGLKLPVGPH